MDWKISPHVDDRYNYPITGGFHKSGCPQCSSISRDFPWNKPSIHFGVPPLMENLHIIIYIHIFQLICLTKIPNNHISIWGYPHDYGIPICGWDKGTYQANWPARACSSMRADACGSGPGKPVMAMGQKKQRLQLGNIYKVVPRS